MRLSHFLIILYLKFNILSAKRARLFPTIKKILSSSAQRGSYKRTLVFDQENPIKLYHFKDKSQISQFTPYTASKAPLLFEPP